MSLHKFAQDVASKGRGDDSLLIHMTPDEVQRLQAFAQANGRSLTINPDTGLPEAGMLSDLFKAVAPIALGAFLGPAGFGLSATMAGVATGGITALATGSLSRGLMAGLGAYGGAGLGDSLMNAGTSAMGTSASLGAGIPGDMAFNLADAGVESMGNVDAASKAIAQAQPTAFDKLGAGAKAVTATPTAAMDFAKDNFKYLGAAATPIMAGAMVPTTTKMPEDTNPAYIRQKLYDPYTQTFKSLKPVKASEWGSRNFSDAYTNPQTGQMATLDVRKPEPMAAGGIVALAGGGVSDQQVVDWFKANAGADDQKIAAAMQQYGVDPAQVARATGTESQLADYEKRYQTATNENILDFADQSGALSTATQGGTGTAGIADWMDKSGINAQEYATALASRFGPAGEGSTTNPYTAQGIQALYDNATMVGNQADIINAASPIKDIHDTRNDKTWVDWMDKSGIDVKEAARAFGLSDKEVQARYDAAKKPAPITFKNPVTGGTMTAPTRTTTTVLPTDPTVNAPPGTKNPYGGPNTPGDKTYNPDGSVTVTPNIPGRPYGGFSGMDEVKNAYTAGGGSLGYIPKAPKTIAEFDSMYNQQTGDSLAAYNYLMGKGGAKFPIQSVAASTGINRPYWTGAMRYKQKFLTSNEDGTVTSSETNPNAPKAKGATGAAKTINVLDAQGNTVEAVLSEDGTYRTSSGDKYDSSGAQVMAQGGISGDGNLNLHIPLDFGGGGGQSGFGDYGAGTPIPMMGTFGGQNNTGTGGYGYADRPDETGGLYKGPMTLPGGLDDSDMYGPEVQAANAANQQRNAAAQAYATANPATASSLAKGMGLFANGGMTGYAMGGGLGSLGGYSDGGRLLKGPGDGVSDSIPATIGAKRQPARLADGEFVIPARIVSELGNGSTEAGAKKLYAMMDRVQRARGKTTGKNKVAANSRADKHLPA
jgi:hypothetical protein